MKKKILQLILCISSILCSCSKPQKQDNSTVVIKPLGNIESSFKKVEDLFTNFEYIPLETKEEFLFGAINKIVVTNERIFVMDNIHGRKIYVFSPTGKFLNTIGKRGGGPGEYKTMWDFTVDKEKEQVVVLAHDAKFYVYDFKGKFINQINTNKQLWLESVIKTPNGYLASTEHRNNYPDSIHGLLYAFDEQFKIIDTLYQQLPNSVSFVTMMSQTLQHLGDNIVFHDKWGNRCLVNPHLNNTLEFKFDFEGTEIPDCMWTKGMMEIAHEIGNYTQVVDEIMLDDCLLTKLLYNRKLHLSVLHLKSNQQKTYRIGPEMLKFMAYKDGYIYSWKEAVDMLKDKRQQLGITPESNPVIVRFKLKELFD